METKALPAQIWDNCQSDLDQKFVQSKVCQSKFHILLQLKVFLQKLHCLTVNQFRIIVLQLFQHVHNTRHRCKLIHQDVWLVLCLLYLVAQSQKNRQSVQNHFKCLDIWVIQKHSGIVFDNVLFQEQIENSVFLTHVGHVTENVANLSLYFWGVTFEKVQYFFYQKLVSKKLVDLRFCTCCDIGNDPTDFSADAFLFVVDKVLENFENSVFEKLLCLKLIADWNVTQNSQYWSQYGKFLIRTKVDKFFDNPGLNNPLYFGFGSFASVWYGPEGIDQGFLVQNASLDDKTKLGDSILNEFVLGKRNTSAKIGQGPCDLTDKILIFGWVGNFYKMFDGTCLNDFVSVWDAITRQITDGPDRLVNKTGLVLVEQLDKNGDGALVNDRLTLRCTTRAHISQNPSGFELQLRIQSLFTHLNENGDELSINDLLDGRIVVDWNHFPDTDDTSVLQFNVFGHDVRH